MPLVKPQTLAGSLLTVGYVGTRPTPSIQRALRLGERAGVIFFKRNFESSDPVEVSRLLEGLQSNAPARLFFAVDQEGGRVARLGAPFLKLPPARTLARAEDTLLERAGLLQARELSSVGFSTAFSPVLDIHLHADNPVIGDRAFGSNAEAVSRAAILFARGSREGGMLRCGKHFPGHGRTTTDSHLELPKLEVAFEELYANEVRPFLDASQAGFESFMSAHVLYSSMDTVPATLSYTVATQLLRERIGFEGVLFSDDLEMKALSSRVEENALNAIVSGCDHLLVCSSEEYADRVFDAIVRELERSLAFRVRVEQATSRFSAMMAKLPPQRLRSDDEIRALVGCEEHKTLERAFENLHTSATG